MSDEKRKILLIGGSRILADNPESEAWGREIINTAVSQLGEQDMVLSGGARGPDTWAREAAISMARFVAEFRLDGFRWDQGEKTTVRWHVIDPTNDNTAAEFGRGPLFRNDKMVELCQLSIAEGWEAHGLFIRSALTKTFGTKYTLDRARSAGVLVDDRIYGVTPEISDGPSTDDTSELPVVWIDLETGGRDAARHALTEIGCVMTNPSCRRVTSTFERKVWPHRNTYVDPEAARITGYDPAVWRAQGAVQEQDMIAQLAAWLPPRFFWGGYNAGFDRRFLRAAFARHGQPVPNWIEQDSTYDPLPRARRDLRASKLIPNTQLGTVCAHFGIQVHAHHALSDAGAARVIYLKLRGEEPEEEMPAPLRPGELEDLSLEQKMKTARAYVGEIEYRAPKTKPTWDELVAAEKLAAESDRDTFSFNEDGSPMPASADTVRWAMKQSARTVGDITVIPFADWKPEKMHGRLLVNNELCCIYPELGQKDRRNGTWQVSIQDPFFEPGPLKRIRNWITIGTFSIDATGTKRALKASAPEHVAMLRMMAVCAIGFSELTTAGEIK